MLQIVASLIDAARGAIYDRHLFIVQATDCEANQDFMQGLVFPTQILARDCIAMQIWTLSFDV
jgi:hypothetical protein